AGGYLLRRGDRPVAAIVPYFELIIPVNGLALVFLMAFIDLGASDFPQLDLGKYLILSAALIVVVFTIALVGICNRWPWLMRWLMYAGCLTIWSRLVGGWGVPWSDLPLGFTRYTLPYYVDFAVWTGVVVLLAYYWDRGRRTEGQRGR